MAVKQVQVVSDQAAGLLDGPALVVVSHEVGDAARHGALFGDDVVKLTGHGALLRDDGFKLTGHGALVALDVAEPILDLAHVILELLHIRLELLNVMLHAGKTGRQLQQLLGKDFLAQALPELRVGLDGLDQVLVKFLLEFRAFRQGVENVLHGMYGP